MVISTKRRGRKGKSDYRGVCVTREGKWRAVIYKQRKQLYLGVFESELEAARAHDRAARYHLPGEAICNFGSEDEDGGTAQESMTVEREPPQIEREVKEDLQVNQAHPEVAVVQEERVAEWVTLHRSVGTGAVRRFQGVQPPRKGNWRAVTYKMGTQLYIGTYPSELEAARAHDRAARFIHGKDTPCNFRLVKGEDVQLRPQEMERLTKQLEPLMHRGKGGKQNREGGVGADERKNISRDGGGGGGSGNNAGTQGTGVASLGDLQGEDMDPSLLGENNKVVAEATSWFEPCSHDLPKGDDLSSAVPDVGSLVESILGETDRVGSIRQSYRDRVKGLLFPRPWLGGVPGP